MLSSLLDSPVKEKVLLFLLANDGSYPREIARVFGFNLNAVLYQLNKLEKDGVVTIQTFGRTRMYSLAPGYPFRRELDSLLQKAFDSLGEQEKGRYRVRPRQRRAETPAPPPAPAAAPRRARPAREKKTPEPVRYQTQRPEPLDFSVD
jgi:predicted ArsR family transcriptional regulator